MEISSGIFIHLLDLINQEQLRQNSTLGPVQRYVIDVTNMYNKALFRMTYLQVLQRLSKVYKTSVYKSGQK